MGRGRGEGEGERGARDRDAGAVRVVLAFSTGVLVRFVGWRGGDSFEGPRRPPAGGARGIAGPQPGRPARPTSGLPPAWSVEFDRTSPLLSITLMFASCRDQGLV